MTEDHERQVRVELSTRQTIIDDLEAAMDRLSAAGGEPSAEILAGLERLHDELLARTHFVSQPVFGVRA